MNPRNDLSLRVLDLFAGHGTATQAFKDRGWDVTTVELEASRNPDIVTDIMKWDPVFSPDYFDFIWASPPCTVFSVANRGFHLRRDLTTGDTIPLTPEALQGVKLVERTFSLINYLKPSFWAVENPRSILRQIIGPPTVTTSYCRWGFRWMKPTDLWGELPPGIDWAMKMCHNGNDDHVPLVTAERSAIKRAAVPYDLGLAIAEAIEIFFLDGPLVIVK